MEILEQRRQRAIPYLEVLLERRGAAYPGLSSRTVEPQIVAVLEGLYEDVERVRTPLLASRPEEPGPDYLALTVPVSRLSTVAAARDVDQFALAVTENYEQPALLREDLEQVRNLVAALPVLNDVAFVVSYLRGMQLRPEDEALGLEQRECLLQANPAYVLQTPSLWDGVAYRFRHLRSTYQQTYRTVHRTYHLDIAMLQRRLHSLALNLNALELLNTLEELGPPLGQDLREEYTRLERAVTPCTRSEADLDLESVSTCAECGLGLASVPPALALESLAHRLGRTLSQQQRRLSRRAVRQILARSAEPHVIRLVQIVRASGLSPLVNVLDEGLVAFLRELLRETG